MKRPMPHPPPHHRVSPSPCHRVTVSPCHIVTSLALLLAACSRPPAVTSRPAPPPPIGDFPAFGGGGPLNNVAPAIGEPPMKVRWTYHAADAVNAAPIIIGVSACVADASGDLTALDLATGAKRWTFHSDAGFEATPLAAVGSVYVGDLSGTFWSVNAATGKKEWSFNAQSAIHAGANTDGANLLFGTDTGLIVCLDRAGTKRWTAQADGRINAPPAIRNGLAAFSSCDSHLRALKLADGHEVFNTDLQNLAPGSACASDTAYFVGTDQGHLLAVAQADGTVLWHFDKIADNAMVFASPALADDTLVIAARNNNVYALRASDGTLKWFLATGADVDASPVISAGRVYVPSKDRRLYVLDLASGKTLWTFEAARPVAAPVAIGRGVLVLADIGGTVYCLEPQ
jgi:outer membrane protein assembly factor BamB